MTYDEQIALHEAAHVVLSFRFGGGPTPDGIDITAPSSVPGAFGRAGVGKLNHDPTQPLGEQHQDLVKNVAIICAGAASDARSLGRPMDEALSLQPGDLAAAEAEIAQSPLLPPKGLSSDDASLERQLVLKSGIETAQAQLAAPEIWDLVEKVAKACLDNGGKLSMAEINAIFATISWLQPS